MITRFEPKKTGALHHDNKLFTSVDTPFVNVSSYVNCRCFPSSDQASREVDHGVNVLWQVALLALGFGVAGAHHDEVEGGDGDDHLASEAFHDGKRQPVVRRAQPNLVPVVGRRHLVGELIDGRDHPRDVPLVEELLALPRTAVEQHLPKPRVLPEAGRAMKGHVVRDC